MKRKTSTLLLILLGSVIGVFMVFPIYVIVLDSLRPFAKVFDFDLLPRFMGFDLGNYGEIFKEGIARYLGNSFFVAAAVTLLAILFHSMAGYSLAIFKFHGRTALFTYIMSTLMIPFAVILIPLFMIVKSMRLLDSLGGIIIPMIFNAYGVFLYRQFYLGFPLELREAARIDGMSEFGIYKSIALPLSGPITVALGVNFFIFNWNNYLWPLIVIQSKALWLVQLFIANLQGDRIDNWNLILSSSCIATVPTVIIFLLFQKRISDTFKMSGIKD